MSTLELQPIPQMPALFILKTHTVVLADLHIGIEQELRNQGVHAPSQTNHLIASVLKLIDSYHPQDLIILGDVKHTIPSSRWEERSDVRLFLETIATQTTIHIVPGNHDGNLQQILPDSVILHASEGFTRDTIGFVHGHRWPDPQVLRSKYVILGHTHPTIQLTDRLGNKTSEPCWLRGRLLLEKLTRRYPEVTKSPEMIIMPAFHPLCGGLAANAEKLVGPLAGSLDLQNAEVYLIDGSFLGKLQDIH